MVDAPAGRRRLLVVGATGMLGHVACRVLADGFDVYGTCRGAWRDHPGLSGVIGEDRIRENCDATDGARLTSVLREIRPAFVLNCVGLIKQHASADDPILSIALNALLPHQLAKGCAEIDAKLIHVSTDCVFSGAKGNYAETDPSDCTDLYGRSKLLGEVVAAPHLTLRTSMIGRQLRGRESLVEWFIGQRGGKVKGFTRAIFSGLTTRSLCRLIGTILSQAPHLHGLYHVASEPISKFELLRRLNRSLHLHVTIEPEDSFVCDRSLDGRRFVRDTGAAVPGWDSMLDEFAEDATRHAR